MQAIALALIIPNFSPTRAWNIALVSSSIGLLLSVSPLLQLPAAERKIEAEVASTLGSDYLSHISPSRQEQMRPQPFVLADVFRGIPIGEVRSQRGITFASPDGVDLKLNIYRPLAVGKCPAAIAIYGGAWRQGDPGKNEAFSRYLAARGYSTIAIDYRHAPQYRFPTQLEDVRTALSYILSHADELEIDPDRLALIGRSAGAHLAMLVAYQADDFPIKAVVNYYGPVNLVEPYYDPPVPDPIDTRAVLQDFLGGSPEQRSEQYRQASPINHIRPGLPPSVFVYAKGDYVVQSKYGKKLHAQMQAAGNLAVWIEIPWAEHAFDAVFSGVSNQIAIYHTERFLAWALERA